MATFRIHFVFVWLHGEELYSAHCSLANQRACAKSTIEWYVLILSDTYV